MPYSALRRSYRYYLNNTLLVTWLTEPVLHLLASLLTSLFKLNAVEVDS
jgi:hypothetical protein